MREIESEGAARAGIGGYNPETAYGGQAYKPPPQPAHLVNHPQYQVLLPSQLPSAALEEGVWTASLHG